MPRATGADLSKAVQMALNGFNGGIEAACIKCKVKCTLDHASDRWIGPDRGDQPLAGCRDR